MVEIRPYYFGGSYGFAWHIGKRWGNKTPAILKPIAMIAWKTKANGKMILIAIISFTLGLMIG